ncbi:hypothetical protein SK128_000923 [Halocaridina rubra]|uniref:Uncharacterized protein n=1 Tax=Halocaridina rubra TaxID=373956 RepID=A0AAN9AEE4_HALRR
MLMFLLFCLGCVTQSCGQAQDYDYFFEYVDSPVNQPQEVQAPLPAQRPVSRGRAPPQQPRARPPTQQVASPDFSSPDQPSTTPVPILVDSRRVDTRTGAFVYEYAGADGSRKYETRYANGTVIGNYTFINDLGEEETRHYSAGVHDPTLIDETTDPNYVDLGNYELYKHLEQPYVHIDGSSSQDDIPLEPVRTRSQDRPLERPSSRPSSRPVARPAPPRTLPEAPIFQDEQLVLAPVPLDFADAAAHFNQRPQQSVPTFDYEDLAAPLSPVPPPPPPPPPTTSLPQGPPLRSIPIRRRPSNVQRPRHRFAISGQSPVSELDSVIRQFQ